MTSLINSVLSYYFIQLHYDSLYTNDWKQLKTLGKLLKIADLQPPDWGQPYWMTLYVLQAKLYFILSWHRIRKGLYPLHCNYFNDATLLRKKLPINWMAFSTSINNNLGSGEWMILLQLPFLSVFFQWFGTSWVINVVTSFFLLHSCFQWFNKELFRKAKKSMCVLFEDRMQHLTFFLKYKNFKWWSHSIKSFCFTIDITNSQPGTHTYFTFKFKPTTNTDAKQKTIFPYFIV